MQNTSQVLLRNSDLLQSHHCLLLGASDTELIDVWPSHNLQLFNHHYAHHLAFQNCRFESQFSHLVDLSVFRTVADCVVIVLPKSRALLDFWLHQINSQCATDTLVLLVGEKNAGIQSASKQLQCVVTSIDKIDMARHCQLWLGRLKGNGTFNVIDYKKTFSTECLNQGLTFTSIPGVFNHGALDEGTELLLDNLGKIPAHRILDFGCGAGVLGLHLKKLQPDADVDMLDASAEAVYASQQSALLNQLDVNVFASNGLSEVRGRYKAIYSNPPFHTGIKTDYSVTEHFIRGAAEHLIEGGELRIVANAFLKYPSLIEKYIGECKVVAESSKFRVYSAIKRRLLARR